MDKLKKQEGDVTVNKELDSIIMKTKPNFTYKEFIQKISHVNLSQKNDHQAKSPKALKIHNKNVPTFSVINYDKGFEKRSVNREGSRSNSPTPKHSPRKVQMKENIIEPVCNKNSKALPVTKSTANKKLKLKNPTKPAPHQLPKPSTSKHSKSIHSKPNFYPNQPSFTSQLHNESCSTFYRQGQYYQNQQDPFHNHSISQIKRSPSQQSKLLSKKQSTSSIDGKLKIVPKNNLTERNNNNGQRVNTQYYEEKRAEQRVNTQYYEERRRMSPSFYKLSVEESSFLDLDQQKPPSSTLFPQQSCTSRCKKSTCPSPQNPQPKPKLTAKSHQHLYNKFIHSISQTLYHITKLDNQSLLLSHKIKYIQFLQCLKQLKMIRGDYQPYSLGDNVDLVKELWEELVMGQNVNHFVIVLALILKITPLEHVKAQGAQEMQNYIYIQKKYEQFRFTRLQLDKSKLYSQKQSIQYYNFPFKPTISKASQQLASQSRSQQKYKINASINSNSHHNQSVQTYSKKQNISISNEFQNPSQSSLLRSTSPLGNKRSDILYKQAKKKSLQKRQNKSTVDYQFQKNKQQLTFKPKLIIKRKKPKPQQPSSTQYISPRFAIDQEKAINRLIRGRVQKQVKQKAIQKGLPYNDKVIQKMIKQKYEEIVIKQNESRMKNCGQNQVILKLNESKVNDSKIKTNLSHVNHSISRDHNRSIMSNKEEIKTSNNANNRCTTQVQHLQNIHNLSFQDYQNMDCQLVCNEQHPTHKTQTSPLKPSNFSYPKPQISEQQLQQLQHPNPDQFFSLDIYYQQDKSDKLMIKRDSTFDEIIQQTQWFVTKHNLSKEMGSKLKQQLMIAMKYHDVEKIQENAEEDQCSLIG